MNKQKLKNLFKIGILIFGISFLLTNCDKNNVSEEETLEVLPELEQHEISITSTSFSQAEEKLNRLKNKYQIDSHVGLKQSTKAQSKSSNSKSGIVIYTDIVKKITQSDYTSYTMLIESLDDDPNTFYNITIEEKNGATGMFVTQYKSLSQSKSSKNSLSKSNASSKTEISTRTISTIEEPIGPEDFGNEGSSEIGGGSGGGSGSTYPSDCDGLVNTTTIATSIPCGCGHSWEQLLNGTCTGCKKWYPEWPSLETTTVYECIPTSVGNPTNGGGTDTGGGVSVPPKEISDDSITTPVSPNGSNVVVTNLTRDLTLNSIQINWLNNNLEIAGNLLSFLTSNLYSDESKEIANEIILAGVNRTLLTAFPFIKYPDDLAVQYNRDYPKLTEYLKNQLPKVAEIPKITNAINEFTKIPIEQIKKDLKWDQGPILKIIQLDNYDPQTDEDTVGFFDKSNPDTLLLDIDYVNILENGNVDDSDDIAYLFFLGTTILHEYVHFGDFSNGFEYPGEEGRLFETKVYGTNVMPDNARLILNRLNN